MAWEERPQTAADVQELVRHLQSVWKGRPRQRLSSICDRFLPTIETHAQLLSVLPDGASYYTPLLYGVLQSVIKVGYLERTRTPPFFFDPVERGLPASRQESSEERIYI